MKTNLLLMMGVLLAQLTWANDSYWQKLPNWDRIFYDSHRCYDIDMAYFNDCQDIDIKPLST